jgi:hypothetical protein
MKTKIEKIKNKENNHAFYLAGEVKERERKPLATI